MKLYIWGTGKYSRKVLRTLQPECGEVTGFVDNDPSRHGKTYENRKIVSFRDMAADYDILIIGIVSYEAVLHQLKAESQVDFSKIIVFFDESYCDNPAYAHIIDQQKWKILLLEEKVERLERILTARIDNAGYEIIDKWNKNLYRFPRMGDTEEAVSKIVNEGCSLVRYGDGEFNIMLGKDITFQDYNPALAKGLSEVIASGDEKLLIGIANNYGNLDPYITDTADGIRCYMDETTRNFHMSVLDPERVYYDAYMFKSYFPYKNREDTGKRIELIRKIWKDRDIVIVEGDKTRAGYGNGLFDDAASLRRIVCPTQNAFDRLEEIRRAVCRVEKESLILVILGPAAELLVYDLMREGYQAVDIGQIDMDYEWYQMGAQKRMPIPDRYVSQLPPAEIREVNDSAYLDQIIERIE